MKQITFKVLRTNEIVVCEDVKDIRVIEDVEYLTVHKENNQRSFLMRKDALEKVSIKKKVSL